MASPVINTFIEFRVTRHARRTRSSPPEFQVHIAIAEASCKRAKKKHRRRRAPADDEQALSEFRQQARLENWGMLATQVVVKDRKDTRRQARVIMAAYRAALRIPTLREALPTNVFMHMANCLGICHVQFAILMTEGVVRRDGENMQIWVPEDAMKRETLQTLLSYAKLFKVLLGRREFALRLPMGGGVACCPMSLGPQMTVEDLKAIAAVSSGISVSKQRMTHLGTELFSGLLTENGVGSGSCVIVTELIDV